MTDTNTITKPAKRNRRMPREPNPAAKKDTAINATAVEQPTAPFRPASKIGLVLQLLQRPEGSTIAQLVAATGWLPHTTRAALSVLKKKGHDVTSSKVDGEERVYRAVAG